MVRKRRRLANWERAMHFALPEDPAPSSNASSQLESPISTSSDVSPGYDNSFGSNGIDEQASVEHTPPDVIENQSCSPSEGISFETTGLSSAVDYPSSSQDIADMSMEYSDSPTSTLSSLLNGAMLLSSRERTKEDEAKRLVVVLNLIERGKLSHNLSRILLRTDVVSAAFGYDVIMSHAERRRGISKRSVQMCPDGHAVATGALENVTKCPTTGCRLLFSSSQAFWYVLISEQLAALCAEPKSFEKILSGCKQAQESMKGTSGPALLDYYDGSLFRRLYKNRIATWNEDNELYIFLSMSSDGFEVFKERSRKRTAWPILFTILNLGFEERRKALNSLVAAFIPGSHDAKQFDSFLQPIIEDLCMLEQGIQILCADGQKRTLYVFVLFLTFDWPAASKICGFVGHNGKKFCRRCGKESMRIGTGMAAVPCYCKRGNRPVRDVFSTECAEKRTDGDIRDTWEAVEELKRKAQSGQTAGFSTLARETGIKSKPLLHKLTLDFGQGVPYDPMHLCLQGWVRHLLSLSSGYHPRSLDLDKESLAPKSVVERMNIALEKGAVGIPGSWGRPSLPVEDLAHYKAEDFKTFGLYLGPVLFSGNHCSTKLTSLWRLTAEMLEIVFDPTPRRADAQELERVLHDLYVLFTKVFFKAPEHSFCFTPTTHAILHLPEMMRECGPLLNVSQFLMERYVGEIGAMVKSYRSPETNLLNKATTLLSIRLLNEGELLPTGMPLVTEDVNNWKCTGSMTKVTGMGRKTQALTFIEKKLPTSAYDVQIVSVKSFAKASFGTGDEKFLVEREFSFSARQRALGRKARQKCWVAGHFASGDEEVGEQSGSDSEETRSPDHVYYGCIREIWQILVQFRIPNVTSTIEQHFDVVSMDWLYGLTMDRRSGTVSTLLLPGGHRRTIRNRRRSVEDLSCIKRVLGYFDYDGRRYFLDQERRSLRIGEIGVLCGIAV